MKNVWNVTFERITPESAEHGDVDASGFLAERCTLRDALAYWEGIGAHVEADCCPLSLKHPPRWFTTYGEMEPATGDNENRSLHIPDHITPASRLRLARLVGCYGVKQP